MGLKVQIYDVNEFDQKTIAEYDHIRITSDGVKLDISVNGDGSMSLTTYSGRKGKWGDTCIISPASGNAFTLDTKGNATHNRRKNES